MHSITSYLQSKFIIENFDFLIPITAKEKPKTTDARPLTSLILKYSDKQKTDFLRSQFFVLHHFIDNAEVPREAGKNVLIANILC